MHVIRIPIEFGQEQFGQEQSQASMKHYEALIPKLSNFKILRSFKIRT